VEEACKGQRFVDKVLAFFVLQIVSDPEVLKELEKLHGEKEQDALSSAGSLHRRHLVADIPGDVEAKQAEAWTRISGGGVGKSWNLTSGPIFVETHCGIAVFRLLGTAWQKGAAPYCSCGGGVGWDAGGGGGGGGGSRGRLCSGGHARGITSHKCEWRQRRGA
jgi:hypothetical protein